jgi:phenylacetate-CoA ligase
LRRVWRRLKGEPVANTGVNIPISRFPGIHWPALPSGADAAMLVLAYQFERSQWLAGETLEALQLRQLETLLGHAHRTVPFYRRRLEVLSGLRKGALDMETWRRIPVLTRAELQDAGRALISEAIPARHKPLTEIQSSGSTGRPVTMTGTSVTGTFFRALNLRFHDWHRRDFSARAAGIRLLKGKQAEAAAEGRPTNWVPAHASGPMYLFDITRPVSEQLEWLQGQDPAYLLTHPSNLAALLLLSRETGARLPSLRQVATMAEVLDAETRAYCQDVWNVGISDSYSAQEVGMIALQCPDHPHYHVQAESVLVEILDQAGRPCPPGAMGRVVVSDLHNLATPLIRYDIGDYAEAGETCPCGRGLPVLKRILGRVRNMATLPSGDVFYPLAFWSPEIMRIAPVRQIQLIQKTLNDIDVKLVLPRPPDAGEEDRLCAYMTERLRHPYTLRLLYVDDIPRSPSGKFEDFVSEIGG